MMFGGEASGRFMAKWPTYFKPRILADCKNQTFNEHVEKLLSAQQNSDESGKHDSLSLKHLVYFQHSENFYYCLFSDVNVCDNFILPSTLLPRLGQ